MAERKSGEGATVEELQAQIEALQQALDEARAAAPDAESILADAEAVRERVQEGLQDVQKQIDAHPVPSALLAFGLGFLIGRLLTR
ncbi:MAG: hypothetical protein U0942_00955 [Parvibaculum sp.]|uniref:hypothetical protein n=1 Tax=Parvibaculum sp. TaxID=2024848 RepID=UPI000CB23206|nr:hypothetical protein [Parvibaculum sp.]MDZ4379892.1 hypothetical protein [Parvibaculum sp.]PKP78774.1 MAG: hypothetical protein CVT81_02435 [Alphaproteobacteria bacterium HGW-Alphaproteobacteria-3]